MHDEFLQTIIAHPDDDAPRLVYADWLEEHGEADRAEFIRGQVEAYRLGENDPLRLRLEARAKVLLKQYRAEWVRQLEGLGESPQFQRGFVHDIAIRTATLIDCGERLLRVAPIQGLRLAETAGYLTQLANCPWLQRITHLDLGWNSLMVDDAIRPHRDELHALLASPHLLNLAELDLEANESAADSAEFLAQCQSMRSLVRLNASRWHIGENGLRALLGSPFLQQLRGLDLAYAGLNDDALNALAQSTLLRHLTSLSLGDDDIGAVGLSSLISSPGVASLQELRLSFTSSETRALIEDMPAVEGVGILLAKSEYLGLLRQLRLHGLPLDAQQLSAMLAAPCCRNVINLGLSDCELDLACMEALVNWQFLSQLQAIDLSNNPVGDAGLRALLNSPHLGKPRFLCLMHTQLSDDGAAALATAANLDDLDMLWIHGNDITPRGYATLRGRFGGCWFTKRWPLETE